jgi:hypothetical protein
VLKVIQREHGTGGGSRQEGACAHTQVRLQGGNREAALGPAERARFSCGLYVRGLRLIAMRGNFWERQTSMRLLILDVWNLPQPTWRCAVTRRLSGALGM